MKRLITKWLTIIILVGFGIYLYFNTNEFLPLLNLNIYSLLVIAVLYVLTFFINSFVYNLFFKNFEKEVSISECFDFAVTSSIANLFVPLRGGAVVRAVYFKNKYDLSYTKFVGMLAGTYLISISVLTLTGILSLLALDSSFDIKGLTLLVALIFMFIVTGGLIFFGKNLQKFSNKFDIKILDRINQITDAWVNITRNRSLLLKLSLLVLINFVLAALITKFEFGAIGINLNLFQTILYSALSALTMFISLTPSALGIREAVFIIFAEYLLITEQAILNVAVIDRGVLVIALLLSYLLLKFRQKISE